MKLYHKEHYLGDFTDWIEIHKLMEKHHYNLETVCRFCGKRTNMCGTCMCDSCYESQKGLESFLQYPKARKYVLKLLGFPKKRVIGPQKSSRKGCRK